MSKFGSMTVNECDILLSDLLKPATLPSTANLFFELYLQDGADRFIDVPVLVRNRRLPDAGRPGQDLQPNQGVQVSDAWRLGRRFFIYDTISGVDEVGGYLAGDQAPEYVRWAEEVSLKVEMDMSSPERIYRPYVAVSYKEMRSDIVNQSTKTKAKFVLEYFSDYQSLAQSVLIGLIFMNILAVLATMIRMYYFTRRNPRECMPAEAA